MSQFGVNDLLNRLGKAPKGVNTGLTLLAVAGASAYGISQSMYTGKNERKKQLTITLSNIHARNLQFSFSSFGNMSVVLCCGFMHSYLSNGILAMLGHHVWLGHIHIHLMS